MRSCLLLVLLLSGCSTGFGEPCSVPRAESFQNACFNSNLSEEDEEGSGSNLEQEAVSSCAIQNYAGCSTRI